MPNRPIRVLSSKDEAIDISVEGPALHGCDGGRFVLTRGEALTLRTLLNAAIDVQDRERGLGVAQAKLGRLNFVSWDKRPSPEDESGTSEADGAGARINARLNEARRSTSAMMAEEA